MGRYLNIFCSVLFVLLLLSIATLLCSLYYLDGADKKFSSSTAQIKAEIIVKDRNIKSPLRAITATEALLDRDGLDTNSGVGTWVFVFCNFDNATGLEHRSYIKVFENGDIYVVIQNTSDVLFSGLEPIPPDVIDSSKVYENILANVTIQKYLEKDPVLAGFSLFWRDKFNTWVWEITWIEIVDGEEVSRCSTYCGGSNGEILSISL